MELPLEKLYTLLLFEPVVSSPRRAARTRLTKLSVNALRSASILCTLMEKRASAFQTVMQTPGPARY